MQTRVCPDANRWAVFADFWFDDGRVASHLCDVFADLAVAQVAAARWGVGLSDLVVEFAKDSAVQLVLAGECLALGVGRGS